MSKKQTFILEISDTQNQSWQGNVEWIQGKKKESFRSVLELLRMLDSVMCPNGGQGPPGKTAEEGTCSGMRQEKRSEKNTIGSDQETNS